MKNTNTIVAACALALAALASAASASARCPAVPDNTGLSYKCEPIPNPVPQGYMGPKCGGVVKTSNFRADRQWRSTCRYSVQVQTMTSSPGQPSLVTVRQEQWVLPK